MAVESTEVSRERFEPVEMLLGMRPIILPRLRGSGTLCDEAVFAFARRVEIALVRPSSCLGAGWFDGAGAVDTVLVGELPAISVRGLVLYARSCETSSESVGHISGTEGKPCV